MNRELWLTEVAKKIEPLFTAADYTIKPYRVTCGWPCTKALGTRSRRIGECHSHKSSTGGFFEIFISPLLDSPVEVAGVITHELVHSIVGIEAGHGAKFVKAGRYVGLTNGQPTSLSPGDPLKQKLKAICDKVGEYPHKAMNPAGKPAKVRPKTQLTLVCGECGCKVRMGVKHFEQSGNPTCGCGSPMTEDDGEGGED